jgi:putative ABC transport system permease protein
MLADLRFALRTLSKSPIFTLITVVTLAIGIGANTAIFAAVRAIFLRPLPYPDGDRIVRVWETFGRGGLGSVAQENFRDWQAQTRTLQDMVAVQSESFNLAADNPERLQGHSVTDGLFRLLGQRPLLGRTFSPGEFNPGNDQVAVLSHGLWLRHFGSTPDIVGRSISLSGKSYTVVGVMPAAFVFPGALSDLWIPHPLTERGNRGSHYLTVLGRLAPGATLEQARADLALIAQRLAEAYPDTNTNRGVLIRPLREHLVGNLRPTAIVLGLAVAFILLIGCANVANLLLARATGRRGEIAVRMALGASRGRLLGQLFTESLVLAAAGGVAGLAIALGGMAALAALLQEQTRALFVMRLDGQVLAFAAGASLISALVFGAVPALQSSRADLSGVLKEGGARATAVRSRGKRALVVVEVGLSVVLLVGAGLLLHSLARLGRLSIGFDPDPLLTLKVALPAAKYGKAENEARFYRRLIEELAAVPGVVSSAAANFIPLDTRNTNGNFEIVGHPPWPPGRGPVTEFHVVSPDYFATLGIAVTRGRAFTSGDRAGAPLVAMVNETFVRNFFGTDNPLGRRLKVGEESFDIVGVAADVRRFGKMRAAVPEAYFPLWQHGSGSMTVVVRAAVAPGTLAGAVRAKVAAIDPTQAIFAVRTMREIVDDSESEHRVRAVLLSLFAGLALLLASLGIYGVMAYHVSQRTQEVGIRMALGARAGQIVAMVVREGMWLCAIGLVLGTLGAILASRLLRTLVFGIETTDVASYLGTAALLALVALFACWLPARRATRVAPVAALRP